MPHEASVSSLLIVQGQNRLAALFHKGTSVAKHRLTSYTIISTHWIIGHQGVNPECIECVCISSFAWKTASSDLRLWDPSTSTLRDFQRLSCRVQVGMDELQGRGGGKEKWVGIKALRDRIISCSPCLKKWTVIKAGVCKKGTCIREKVCVWRWVWLGCKNEERMCVDLTENLKSLHILWILHVSELQLRLSSFVRYTPEDLIYCMLMQHVLKGRHSDMKGM